MFNIDAGIHPKMQMVNRDSLVGTITHAAQITIYCFVLSGMPIIAAQVSDGYRSNNLNSVLYRSSSVQHMLVAMRCCA